MGAEQYRKPPWEGMRKYTLPPPPPGFWSGFQDGYEKGRGETAHRYWKYALWMWALGLAGGLVLGWALHSSLR